MPSGADFRTLCPEGTFLAPMEGVSHPEFRHMTAERGGVSIVCTEFVRITNHAPSVRHLAKHVVPSPGARLSVQVMGNSAANLADAARIVEQAGADVVDLNVGCPAPRVVRKGVGAAMLRDPQLLFEVVSAMRASVSVPLSAKIRAGFDDAANVVGLALTLQDAGIDFLTVHPRRRCDFYSGVADWRIIRALKRELSIPVVGNGDVWYAADALRLQRETGADAVMIGRPAIRNPWIFEQLRALRLGRSPVTPTGEMFATHLEQMVQRYTLAFPHRRLLGPMKETVRWMGRAVRDGGAFTRAALRSSSVDELLALVARAVAPLPSHALDLAAEGGDLERSGSTRSQRDAA